MKRLVKPISWNRKARETRFVPLFSHFLFNKMPRIYKQGVISGRNVRRENVAMAAAADRAQRISQNRKAATARRLAAYRPPMPETKYFDVGINAPVTTAGTTWADTEVPADNYVDANGSPAAYTANCLLPTAQGSGYGQVVGTKYRLKRLRIKGALFIGTNQGVTITSNPLPVRLVLVEDLMPAGTQAQGEEVFQDFGATEENAYAFQRMASGGGKFRVLKEKLITINPLASVNNAAASTVSTTFGQPHFKFNVNFGKNGKDVMIRTGNATPAVAGTVNCNIFLLAYCYQTTSAATVNVQACSRAYYSD